MIDILKRLFGSKERRKHLRTNVSYDVKFRILDSKDSSISSRAIQGKIIDISVEGGCIETSRVQIDGLHVFHPSSPHQNRLDVEIELNPSLSPLKSLAEVKWYKKVEEEGAWIYKMGIRWINMSESNRKMLKNFLKEKIF